MVQLGRITFLIGAIAFIFIGAMHSFVHLTELAGPELQARFDAMGPVLLQGNDERAWDLFQGLSLLMGFFSMAFGVALIGALMQTPKTMMPHPLICLSALALLVGIASIGALYLSNFQVFGGLAGIVCFAIPLVARIRS